MHDDVHPQPRIISGFCSIAWMGGKGGREPIVKHLKSNREVKFAVEKKNINMERVLVRRRYSNSLNSGIPCQGQIRPNCLNCDVQ